MGTTQLNARKRVFRTGTVSDAIAMVMASIPGISMLKAEKIARQLPRARVSKYSPHQGEREKARRRRQRESGFLGHFDIFAQ